MNLFDTSTPIVEEIVIAASAARIFTALTEPSELVVWWGGDGYRCTSLERDLRVGGRWHTTGVQSDGEHVDLEGIYRVVEPPYALEFTWRYDWHPTGRVDTVVRFDLEECAGGTRVRVTHSGFTDAQARASHDEGWAHVLGWLRCYTTDRARVLVRS